MHGYLWMYRLRKDARKLEPLFTSEEWAWGQEGGGRIFFLPYALGEVTQMMINTWYCKTKNKKQNKNTTDK